MSEYHACESRNAYPGEIVLSEYADKIRTCQENIDISFQESDFHNYQLLDILRGRKLNQYNGFRQLNSNKDSKIIVLITSHGGENFIKVRNFLVVLSDELNRTLNEMYIKGKYKELVFVVDTCEGYSLYDHVKVPNIYFISSSALGQKASSYSYDENLMGPTVDKFHFLLYNSLKNIHENRLYNTTLDKLFGDIKAKKKFLETDVIWDNKINRVPYVNEFFGNNQLKNEKVLDVSNLININNIEYKEEDAQVLNNFIESNKGMEDKRKLLDDEVMKMRNYHEERYTLQK
jgi:phosphatidylinositol glycan class K